MIPDVHTFIRRRLSSRLVAPAVILFLGIILSVFAYQRLRRHEYLEMVAEMDRQVDNHFNVAVNVVRQQDLLVTSIQDLFTFSDHVSREGFQSATRRALARETGLKWIDWAPRVKQAERSRFEESVRSGGFPQFHIHDPGQTGGQNSPARNEYFPILYTGTSEIEIAAMGLDLASDPKILKRIYEGRDRWEGMVVLDSKPLRALADQFSLLVVVPTYEKGYQLHTAQDRRDHFSGCLHVVFGLRDLIESHTDPGVSSGVEWLLLARMGGVEYPVHFYSSEGGTRGEPTPTPAELRAGIHREKTFYVAGMELKLVYRPTAALQAREGNLFSRWILLGGLSFSGLLFAYLVSLAQRRRSVEIQVERRTDELRTATQRIRSSEARFRTYMDHSPVLAWLKDSDLKLRFVNKAFRTLFNMNPDKTITGLSDFDYLDKGTAESVRANDQKVLKGGMAVQTIEDVAGADGVMRHWLVTKFPFDGADGKRWVGGTAFDVTDRERARTSLIESEQRLKAISDHLPEAVVYQYAIGVDGRESFNYLSAGVEQSTGHSRIEVYANPALAKESIQPEDSAGMMEATRASARNLTPLDHEFRRRMPDGRMRWFHSRSMPRRMEDGSTVWDGVEVDVTARKQGEQLLAWEKSALELITSGNSLRPVLEGLMLGLEKQAPGSLCSVLLLDRDGVHLRHGAGPSLPQEYNRVIDGVAAGPNVGSCGTAAHDKRQVIVSDIATDPLWADFRELASSHDLRACWSTPVTNREGKVLGTFAIYYREPRSPSAAEFELIERSRHIVRIAIEQWLAEESLRLARQREDLHRQQTPLGVIQWDLDFTVREWNPAAERIFGHTAEQAAGQNARFIVPPEYHQHVDQVWAGLVSQSGGSRSTNDNIRRDGRPIQCEWYNTPLVDDQGQVIGVASLVQEVTDQRTAQEALRQERNLMRTLIDRLPESIYLKDRLGAFLLINEASRKIIGVASTQDAVGKTVNDFFPAEVADLFSADDRHVIETRQPILDREEPFQDAAGNVGVFLTAKLPLLDGDGTVLGLVGISRDITERKRAEEEMRRLTNSLEQAQTRAKLGSWEMYFDGTPGWWSPEMYRLFGFDPAGGSPSIEDFLARLHPDDQETMRQCNRRAIQTGEPVSVEFRTHPERPPERHFVETAHPVLDGKGRVVKLTGTVQDISERVQAETEKERIQRKLEETQKLESLGVLAGGIAHDFNNLLTGILGNASLMRMELPEGSPLHEGLADIEGASMRAADLCRQMLAYAGKGRLTVKAVDLSALVADSEKLLRISISKSVALNLRLGSGLPAVSADETQLRQILMNLVINASEAVGGGSGVISVGTGSAHMTSIDVQAMRLSTELGAGTYVFLEVSDNGSGMDKATLERIFDPFFTTKFLGRGLGLAAVMGIVRSHKGGLKVYSEPGKGTTFKLLLPCTGDPAERQESAGGEESRWRGQGTVLIVDDEETVRKATQRMLETVGFDVVLAVDGADGLVKYREMRLRIDLVLLDLTMPNMDGVEAFRELRRERSDVKVLLMSGFSEQEAVSRFMGRGLAGFIQKPFKSAQLRQKIIEVMAESRPGLD